MRAAGLLLVLLLAMTRALADSGFVVSSKAKEGLDQDLYLLDLQIDYGFSDVALEALDNGVPLTLVVKVQVRRKGAWIWEENLVDMQRVYLIRYQPLSEIYQVASLPDGGRRSFVTRSAAISALGEISGLPLVRRSQLDPEKSYLVRVKVELDIEALPLPLRPRAYLSPSWNLSSGWSQWPLEP